MPRAFDLLLRGLEVTTAANGCIDESDLEAALQTRGIEASAFESHLKMFDFGMPPHGGLAIGLERPHMPGARFEKCSGGDALSRAISVAWNLELEKNREPARKVGAPK